MVKLVAIATILDVLDRASSRRPAGSLGTGSALGLRAIKNDLPECAPVFSKNHD
jgi:hypothetical protein